ncbi:MAG: hypothetical protein QOF79_809 [Actinomycetota bacterium]|jgi:uncharacterized protein YndB with AHSA1/START domain|nr:hypothetical protein [Actinomycetota bacterium]
MTETKKEFTITRVFDAPVDVVWRAWTDPDEVVHWLHPRGVTTPRDTIEFDTREGGEYRYTMVNDADGSEYPTGGTYLEVIEPERLKFTWGNPDESMNGAPVITVTLASQGDKTEMTFHLEGLSEDLLGAGIYEGWQSAFDVMDDYLSEVQSGAH